MSTDKKTIICLYHDIEQNIDSQADPESSRQMLKAFLDLEKKYQVKCSYNLVGKLYQEQPDLKTWILEGGHDLAWHSYHHYSDWNPSYFVDEIKRCHALNDQVVGYRSPQSQWNKQALQTMWDHGFLWSAEGDPCPEPYFIYKGLVRLPVSGDDWPLNTGEQTPAQWVDHFKQTVQQKPFVAWGMHDCVASYAPEERLQAWEDLLKTVAADENLVAMTFSLAADLYRRASLSHYYTQTAVDWNRDTQPLYRTKRFQEMIRHEAEQLEDPVVADLGSGGGVLSAPLKDIAQKIYCVDHAPGMVDDVESAGVIEARVGEITDSGLDDHCADLVICARVIEYLFWPEDLAAEIKRVGKPGATVFVTFPAITESTPSFEGPSPDRIRKHYSPDDIQKWSQSIGPGTLAGVQPMPYEPQSPEDEAAFRQAEQSASGTPTNWVWIGKIAEAPESRVRPKAVLAHTAAFEFAYDQTEKPKLSTRVRAKLSRLKAKCLQGLR